ncbi:hypothetical protein ACHWQZ_G005527 [Mnemiopsis leidyi]
MVSPALIIALLISSIWLAYVAFYNSRVQGIVCTWILRHLGYIKNAEVKFGSISISILGGKIMFRELRYITKDFALRSVDGAFIFKWFTRLSPDDISRESQTWSLYHIIFQSRALLTLHGLEMHIYNRTSLYDDLEKVAKSEMDVGMPEDRLPDPDSKTPEPVVEDNSHSDKWGLRNLIPVLVVEVQKGKFVVGNNLTETVMFVDIETATAIYSTPSSKKQQLDPYMHMIRSKINKIRITLNKSPGFKGLYETPPSQPEAGVPLLRSREVRVQYIQDMPGRVTKLQRSAESSPEWEMTLKFMRETHIYYGPWIDRQRDILYKFFFPYDYKVAEVSKPLKVGDLRRHQHMNVIIDFEAKATLTILFFREEATSSINLDIANGSRVQMQIPWTTTPQGFTTQIVADLYKVECQTSLDYRPFLEADEVHAIFTFQYPRVWHHRQSWECDFFNVSRPTLHFVFDHVAFMTDLLDDWGPVTQPDLLSFVPYVWRFDFKFTDALVVLPVSQHNWVDCIQNRIENSETVFFGLHCDILDIHFELPWTNYQPATTEIRFDFNAEDITGSIWLPKYHTLRDSLKQFNMGKFPAWLERAHVDKVGEETGSSNKDKNVSAHDLEGWEECWSLQDLFLRFTFLSNSALPFERPGYQYNMTPEDKTNHLGVEVMLGPSVIRLHGVFFRHLWFFKDNYFGYDDKCTPLAYLYNRALIDKNKNPRVKRPTKECPMYDLDVNCKVIVKDILGEFPRHCDEPNDQIKLPIAQIDGIVFELTKTRHEAKMELTISPITFLFSDSFKRPTLDMHLAHGFLQLQGINVIMCGLYSGVGINNPKNPFDFLEYAFLVEVTTGALVGKLTVPHIQKLVHWLEIFLWQSLDRENEMPTTEHQINIEQVHSSTHRADIVQTDGHTSSSFSKLRSSQQKKLKTDDLKYLMIKVSVAHTDLYVVEAGCACKIATKSIRIALCNAHDENTTLGVTVCVQGADVTQYVRLPNDEDKVELENKSQWLEAGVLSLPPVMFDVNKRLGDPCLYKREQREFLKCHDKVNQCLLFLWMPEEYKGCGCVGGVAFNNTTLIEVNGFYFEPVVVPPDFCQSASPSSNTPWKLGRGASVVMTDGSSRTSPGSSVSSRQSDKRKHVSELLNSQGFGGLSPADAKPKRRPPTGKKKTKGRDSGEWFTTFPQRSGRKPRDKQKTLSHYNDLLKNFSIKRNISRLSSKRKSKGSDAGGSEHSFSQQEPVLKVDNEEEAEKDGREEKEDIYSSTPSIAVRSPSVSGTAPTVVDPNAMKGSSESLELSAPQEYESAEDEAKRSSKQSLSLQSPGSGSKNEDRSSSLGRRSKSRGGTLSRSSSQDSFKSARSEFRHTDAASSAAEEEADTTEAEDEENQVKDLSIPFPFPKAADHALNHELIDIYRDHLPHAWLTETRYSNTVVLNKSYSDLAEVDMNKIPHRISPHKRQSRGSKGSKGSKESDVPPVEPAIHELLQIVKYILPDFHPDSAGSTSSDVTSDNLFSSDSFSDTKSDPRLLELRRKWEKKLKEKKVSTDDTSETDSSVTDGKVICVAEIVDPVDLFFTPFCVHAVNKYIETAEAYYRDLHPAAVVNLVQAATAPTVLEIAIQHATAQKALLFSNHLQPIGMKKFDNSLERTIEERLNLELFLYIPVVSIRTLQGGGDLQWVGTEAELETARSKAQVPFKSGSKSSSKDHGFKDQGAYTTDDDALTDRSESARSDISLDPSSGKGSSNVICPNKIAKLSLIKCVANNIDVSFSYHQFESQKPMGSGGGRNKSVMESALPGEYTQTAFKASVDGIYGQLHILHPMIGKQSDTFIPYTKTRMVAARKIKDNVQKLSSRETSVVIELGAEKCKFSGGSLKRNLLVALPEPPEQQKPKKKEEEKQDIPSFALDGDRDEDGISSEKVSMGAEVAASLTTLTNTYNDKSSINGHISELWIQIATPSAEKTDSNLFNPYTSLPHAVFSWSEPGSLFAQHLTQLFHHKLSRVQAVIAALLAEALGQETQYEPPNYTTKHSRLTIASKTLKESAVIRLMNQLRYTLDICKDTNTDLYNDLKQDFVPRRIILERGVQSMLAAIEGNLLLTTDSLMDNMSVQAPPTSHQSPPSNHLPDVAMSDKTPVYYVGKQDYGSIAALDKISIGKPPQNVQVEAKHRTHRHALIEMSSSDKAKLAEKYFALYQALQLRLPKTDHVNHQLKMEIDGTSIIAIDCHRDLTSDAVVSPFFNAKNFFLETSLFPAQKEFSIPRHSKKGVHKRSDSRSSSGVTEGRTVHRSDSTDSLFSKRSSMSGRHHPASSPPGSGPPPRPPRKKKSKKFLDVQLAQNVKKSISHVVKHLVINTQIETCVTEINLDLLRLSKALVDGMSNFQPGSFHPALGDSAVLDGSGPPSPTGDPPLRSVEDQFALAGAWEKMDEYIQLMFRGDPTVTRTSSDSSRPVKPRIDRDVMLYSEAPDIPLSVTATWRFDNAEIIGRLQGLRAHINVGSISGAAAILQNLYVEMNNSPNSDIILEPLSPNIISGNLDETNIAVNFYDEETKQDCQLICVDVPTLNTVYSFLPHVTRIQKMFINVTELKAKVPKPIVEIKNVLLISTKLVLHEIKSFERYFQRPQQSLQRIHIENPNKQTEIDLNLVIRAASIDLYILPSLSLKHGIGDLHVRFAQNKGQTAQLDIHHHELSLNAKEIDLHTHLPLPQIFIRIEKVKKRDPSGIRSGIHGEHYTGVVEIKTFQLQLPTTMLNHVLLVQNAFMKEINEFLDTINLIRYTVEKTSPIAKSSSLPTSAHMVPFAFTMKLQGIDLLATTPSDLAMSLKTETINVEVKNRMVTERITVARDREQIIERPRMFISTMITTDITLGQLADIDPGVPRSSEEDMVKFLQFRATASLGNNEGLFENKLSSSESFHATISNPQLFMQPGAFDKALLFYLNFKTAYAIFNDDRQKLNDETVTATETFKNRFNLPEGPPVLPSNTQLKMTVRNLAVCLPIQKSSVLSPTEELLSASQTDLVKYSPGDGALSISIKTAEMKMAFGVIHNNKGLFNDFVIRFIDEFDEKKWMENAAPRSAEKELNSISIDSGNYDYTTLTTSTTGSLKEAGIEGEQSGKMTVGVISDIKGVNVHLSTNIITKLVGLYKTLTSIVGTDDPKDDGIEPIDETELVKNLGVQSAEKGQFNEEEAVKIWKRTALHADKKDKEKLERTTSGAKRKKQQASGTQGDKERKQPDEVSMYSTRTSKSVLRDEESVSSSVGSTLPSQALEPPLLEFQLDLDLRLGNGRITLYPTSKTDESMSKKGRFQGRFNESQDFVTDNTEFLIPETRCELHYTSSKLTEKSSVHAGVSGGVVTSATSRVSAETTTSGSDESGTKSIKTGSLYSSVRVLSLKQDQIIRPCLLEYLDQLLSKDKNLGSPSSAGALQTFIPEEIEEILKDPKRSKTAIEEAKTSPTPSSEHSSCKPAPTDTFPVDIIIMVMVEPSTIKLSCQPFSRHECSLVVPRSCFLLSTKGTPSQVLLTAATGRKEVPIIRDGSTSCWNVTWCLEQCKLSLYHPLSAMSSYQQSQSLPSRAEVRNALSVTIGGGNVAVTRITTPKELTNSEGVSIPGHNPKKLIAHISSMLDIGKVDLTYDIKRMDEVESFHNAWLSGEFIKRILLLSRPIGEMGSQDAPVSSPPLSPSSQPKPLTRSDRFYSTYEKPRTETYFSLPRNPQALREIREESPKPSSPAPGKPPVTGPASTVTTRSSDTTEPEIAETNLMLAINSREITLTTNLGHTLGRINISIANSMNSTTLCLKERHNEQRKVDVLIGKVLLESTAGLITGLVKVENLAGIFEHCISPEKTPTHSLKVYFECFENKLEYLSNCIHMLRITGFCTELTDRWKEKEGDSHLSVGGSIRWDLVQTMIHCNTAPNLLQIKAHLNEFIVHQKKYSQRTYLKLLNLEPEEKEHHVIPLKQYELEAQVLAHHWFWAVDPHSTFDSIKVLLESGLFLKPLKLGGSLKINGEQFSVALFQGEKFRDDTWALINLNKIGMRYDTQVEQLMKGTQTSRVTKQQAVIVMGDFEPEEIASLKLKAPNNSIGLVEKCVRSTKLSPPERTDDIKKWLQYACTHDFAHGNPDKERKTRATIFGGGSVEFSTIFQLPEMKLNLTTDHNWEGAETGSPTSNRSVHHLPVPIVNCRLRSHFRGSIGLATNAGNYFFLHDLAQRYTKKMEIYMEANPIFAFEKKPSEPQVSSTGYSETAESTEDTQKYAREFVCEEWELKPPLRLQGGGKVEVNVDWVLNKLGFKNPTVTIPKWIQRGPMDPLDYFISGLVKTLVFQQAEIISELKSLKKS